MNSKNFHGVSCRRILQLLFFLGKKLKRLYSKIPCFIWRRPRPRVVIKKLARLSSRRKHKKDSHTKRNSTSFRRKGELEISSCGNSVRVATFNAALFAVSSVVPKMEMMHLESNCLWSNLKNPVEMDCCSSNLPKSILKNSPLHTSLNADTKSTKSKLRVSINLPENEISLSRSRLLGSAEEEETLNSSRRFPVRSPLCFPVPASYNSSIDECLSNGKTIFEVVREVDADILALQDVKADEEKGMQPLSDLARLLGMNYVFAESWAPEYGNAILSKWPILRWKVHKIANDEDIRNVLQATINVPGTGQVNVYCTQLDYLDEKWRMKQVNAILKSSEGPHILAGGLNSLDRSDYSLERWIDIVKYFEEIGKPKPKDEVMSFLKQRGYHDAKDCAGEFEPAVIIAKGQDVQGTCKYGTRVDYILSSPGSEFKFVPGSYAVVSSKGTSDHHIVKVDIVKEANDSNTLRSLLREHRKMMSAPKVVRNMGSCSSRAVWMMDR